ncbi:AEC family transporter [Enterococcus massiliensis]|uniref:AEC family transporter n=1 Tax=Enterococcus massiliensis TaxID=1640685 RepID=UPI00065E1E89|nr:AEC family transporter [Enterococcus massiliensis]
MATILINAVGLFVIIFFGYLLKRLNLLSKADGTTLSVIILTITLPATIIVNFASLQIKSSLFLLIFLGFGLSILQVFVSWLLTKKEAPIKQEFMMYMASGFNIGNFTLPFVQSFLPIGIPLISMFDLGNSIMLAGGTTVLVDHLVGKNQRFDLRKVLWKLFRSIPYTAYLVMLLLRVGSIELPESLLTVLQPIAYANTFLSMFMIGLFLELRLPKSAQRIVLQSLVLRYGIGLGLVVLFLFLPLPQLVKLVLCLLAVAPIATFNVINAVAAGVEEEIVGFCSSVSFLLSLGLMTVILLLFGGI